MHVVGSSISAAAAAAGSHKPAWAQKPASSGGDALATGGPATEPVDQVTLSAAAQELSAHGNAANSRAHLARAWIAQPGIAQQSGLADMPFGKVVSGLIHGTLQAATASDVTDTGATGDAPAATGEEPSVIPAGDDAAPGTDSVDAGASTATGEEPPAAMDSRRSGSISNTRALSARRARCNKPPRDSRAERPRGDHTPM